MADKAVVFTDGRYTLAIKEQVDPALYETRHVINEPPTKWIEDNLGDGGRLGYDPWLHTLDGVERLRNAAEAVGGSLVPLDENPIDPVWETQPPAPITPVVPHGAEYAGRSIADKRIKTAEVIAGVDRARDVLGFEAQYTNIEDTVRHAWDWLRAHPNGYSS